MGDPMAWGSLIFPLFIFGACLGYIMAPLIEMLIRRIWK